MCKSVDVTATLFSTGLNAHLLLLVCLHYFVLICTPPKQFAHHWHCCTEHSKILLLLSVKCLMLHSPGNFPKDAIFSAVFLSLCRTHIMRHTSARVVSIRVCMRMCFIFLCVEKTPRCVSLLPSVTMMKGSCCSQQKPLFRPKLLTSCLHYSQIEW